MTTAKDILTRDSICVTCLSRDRKLFPVNDCKSHALFLNLSEDDKLCWECNFFVLKVAAFRSRAERAQALLTSALESLTNVNEIKTLSNLTTTPVCLNASLYTPDPLQVIVKAEPLKLIKEEPENNECKISRVEEPRNSYNVTCDESDDEGMVNVTLLPVLQKKREASSDEESSEAMEGKTTPTNDPPKKYKKDHTIITIKIEEVTEETQDKEVTTKEVAEVKEVKQTAPIDPDSLYTVKVLSEEEMLEWRERKKTAAYYATSIPGSRCKKCIEPFESMKMYTAHKRRHEEDYGAFACHICGLRSLSESALSAHTTQHYRLLQCNFCAHEWDCHNVMRRHCSVAHGVPITVWHCNQCERQFPTQRQQTQHMICHRVVSCPLCGKQIRQNNLTSHMKLHTGIPLRCCSVCGGQYRGDEGLATHMKTHDTKVDLAAFCAECNIQFRTMQLYRNHRRYTLKHASAEDMPFKCSLCGKSFLQRAMLKLHIDGVHSDERRHKCGVCGQTFKTRIAKRNHERSVHEGVAPRRNKVCDHCGRAFTTKSSLQDHINSHTGARPFSCRLCDATFGYKSALYLHGRFKHKIKKKVDSKVEDAEENT